MAWIEFHSSTIKRLKNQPVQEAEKRILDRSVIEKIIGLFYWRKDEKQDHDKI
jgi:hypothetical protein